MTAKEMAIAICNGDIKARNELEKMMGCKLENMADKQKLIGLTVLCVFEKQWRNKNGNKRNNFKI